MVGFSSYRLLNYQGQQRLGAGLAAPSPQTTPQLQLAGVRQQAQALILGWPARSSPAATPTPIPTPRPPAAPSATAGSGPALRAGLSGTSVRALQTRLQQLGFNPGGLDGAFGPNTEAAVRRFQAAHHLQNDGVVGPQTWRALGVTVNSNVRSSTPTPIGHTGSVVDTPDGPMVSRQGKLMSTAIAPRFDRMVAAARAAGIDLTINNAYRSYAEQQRLYQLYLAGRGAVAAKPGTSNHETGKAIDFSNTPGAYAWLRANASRFGLYNYPPEAWHYSINGSGGPPGATGVPASPRAPAVFTIGLPPAATIAQR